MRSVVSDSYITLLSGVLLLQSLWLQKKTRASDLFCSFYYPLHDVFFLSTAEHPGCNTVTFCSFMRTNFRSGDMLSVNTVIFTEGSYMQHAWVQLNEGDVLKAFRSRTSTLHPRDSERVLFILLYSCLWAHSPCLLVPRSRKLIQESEQHLKDVEKILQNDKRYLVLECVPEERRKLIMFYIEDLDRRGPPPPPTASEPTRRSTKWPI